MGWWGHATIRDLVENRTISGPVDYGRRSEGKHRRLGPDGPRYIDDRDLNARGRPKMIRNDPSLLVSRRLPFVPLFYAAEWERIREDTRRPDHTQAGIARSSDPGKYPLPGRASALSGDCGQSCTAARAASGRSKRPAAT